MNERRLVFRIHAVQRMFERSISPSDVSQVLTFGDIIEEYPTDRPFPSRLMLGFVSDRPLHVVVADDNESETTYVITVYEPDPDQWTADLRRRK